MNYDTLKEKYPLVFPVAPRCGVWIPKGWEDLIDSLCDCIQAHLNDLICQGKFGTFRVDQIKEKFGGLRFYVSGEDDTIKGMIRMAETLSVKIKYEY
jgi:hypothetical protein